MKRKVAVFLVVLVVGFLTFDEVRAQCPEDTIDRGACDTLHVVPWNDGLCDSFPCFVHVLLLVTHDSNTFWWETESKWVQDSVASFTLPLVWTRTNPAAYCSLSTYWNETAMNPYDPRFPRSIFRHFEPSVLDSNRMAWLAGQFQSLEWSTIIRKLTSDSSWYHSGDDSIFTPPRMWLSMVPSAPTNRRWWEGERTLLATMTFLVSDTMHICIDSTFWPPSGRLKFTNHAAWNYIPRHNLPICFKVDTAGVGTAVESEDLETGRPERVRLFQNYPNPFNPVTNVEFSLYQSEHVTLEIFNILGQKVKTLLDGQKLKAGSYSLSWDGRDQKGNAVSSGVYFCRLQAGDFSDVKKMMFLE